MKKRITYLVVMMITLAVFISCSKKEDFPVEPEIKFENFIKLYNPVSGLYERGVLTISFTDGDGDIGLRSSDSLPPYDYNFYIKYFELQNGDTVEVHIIDPVSLDTLTFNQRIPMLTPDGSDKSIKGEIEDTLFIYNYSSTFDTIMFELYIVDRALHQSNTVQTPLIKRN
ncbi:MAG: hypothetical protein JW731_05640 [Bacteroidales bacterium]|nr:hypothetical protein [Bacteroidales bacterium]